MRFDKVHLEAFGHALPDDPVTSLEIEARLAPLYERMGFEPGRIEMLTGIRERRYWPKGTKSSEVAVRAGRAALEKSGIDPARIGCLINASVTRDHWEPANATIVHHLLGLAPTCHVFDLSNACLGFVNAMTAVASMIEHGDVEAGLVVTGEDARDLVDETIRYLNDCDGVSRADVKQAIASLTIASGAAAVVLTHRDATRRESRLVGGVVLAASEHHALCVGDHEESGPRMTTDADAILYKGTELAKRTWRELVRELGWAPESFERIVTHQVTAVHKKLLFETLELDPEIDFPTVETLGNTGSAALPISFSLAVDAGFIRAGQRVGLLGIGSGLNCIMLGVEW